MMKANKANACQAVVIGSEELQKGVVTLKNLDSGNQKEVLISKLKEEIKNEF